jgi:hypothetical protein
MAMGKKDLFGTRHTKPDLLVLDHLTAGSTTSSRRWGLGEENGVTERLRDIHKQDG